MFGSKRKKLTNTALDRLRPSFYFLTAATGDLPPGLTDDPYVIGYVSGTVAAFVQVLFRGKIENEDLGFALNDVFIALFRIHPVSQPAILSLTTGERKDPEFIRGSRAAGKMVCAMMELPNYESDPDVLAAKAEVRSRREWLEGIAKDAPENVKIAACLQRNLFDAYLSERYVSG